MKLASLALTACLLLPAAAGMAAETALSEYTEHSATADIKVSWQRSGLEKPDAVSDDMVARKVREFRATAREEHASLQEIRGEDTPPLEMNLKGTLSGNGRTVTMLWEDYMYLGGAHGGLVLSSQTYALPDGRPVGLNDLFPNTGKALHLISVLSRKDLLARGLPQDMVMAGTMPEEDNFSTFLLEKDGITFYFSPYQVASWADGVITVTLKLKDLAGAAPHRQYWK